MDHVTYSRSPKRDQLMISFAQNGEDILIDRVFPGRKGFYIDVGADDPVVGSVTKYLYLQGWRGINIEPDDTSFPAIQRDRPLDINLNCAVGRTRGPVIFYQLPGSGLSTCSPEFLSRFSPTTLTRARRIEVGMRTLADICAEFVTCEIDLLKVDAEGAEGEILAGADWQRFRPRLLVVEATKPWTSDPICGEWEPSLLAQGYVLCAFDGINRYYLRNEDRALAVQLSVPVNCLDSYITFSEMQLREQIAAQEEEIQRLRNRLTAPRQD